jgi:hypothetical protein
MSTETKAQNNDARLVSGTIGARIADEVGSWDGVVTQPHRFGGVEFTVGRREIGHLHGSRLADIPFPVRIREQSGWISYWIRGQEDVTPVIELFRMSYERPWSRR